MHVMHEMHKIRGRLLLTMFALMLPAAAAAQPAARLNDPGDPAFHAGSTIVQGVSTVLINGLPAARLGHTTTCPQTCLLPFPPFTVPHGGGTVFSGSGTVFIGGAPAARVGDTIQEPAILPFPQCDPFHSITSGSTNVLIGP